jgi:hypothetical protein
VSSGFDRVRPRDGAPTAATAGARDPLGKRALFSSGPAGSDDQSSSGSVTVDCSGCGQRTVLSPVQAVRAVLPSLLLGIEVRRGGHAGRVGLGPERAAWVRCPACQRRRWSTLTLTL